MSLMPGGVWLGLRCWVPLMVARGGGAIVNTASIAGLMGTGGAVAYGASKHGVISLTKSAARTYASAGVRINAVCPGYVLTPMQEAEYTPAMLEQVNASIPLGRHAAPEEIAALYAFLASDEGAYFTGAVISIDGGETA